MAGYIGSKAVSVNTTSATISDDLAVGDDLTVTDDATIGGTLGVTGILTATSLDISGDIDVDGTANLDIVDIDGAVDMATTALVTGVLTTTAQAVFNGGFAAVQESTVLIADGQADNAYAFQIKNEESTDDRSYGLLIHAGSTGTDRALAINTHDGNAALFYVQGNGQALFTDGTASLPSITNNGDVNTGIFFPAADTLGFATNGSEVLRFTTANVQLETGIDLITNTASGTTNTRIGTNAGDSIVASNAGVNNILIGTDAGTALDSGDTNIAIGIQALAAEDDHANNIAIGYQALYVQDAGVDAYNVAIGYQAGVANSSGLRNMFIGASAGAKATTSDDNLALGYNSGGGVAAAALTGNSNVSIGNTAGGRMQADSNSNVFIGSNAGLVVTTHDRNCMVGESAGSAVNSSDNTFIGNNAGTAITDGDANTVLGRYSGNQNNLDIRSANNNIVLSDGDGTPKFHYHSSVWFSGNGEAATYWPAATTATSQNAVSMTTSSGSLGITSDGTPIFINKNNADGSLVLFYQAGANEGSISVSGTTVSYNGGHLSRWSQLSDGSKDSSLVKGTVMTNLDKMAVWEQGAVAEGDTIKNPLGQDIVATKADVTDAYTEDNEQLNCMAVSSVEGDANVAGVFVNWDAQDDGYNDMNIAMTGDMIIRIAQGTTVARGDLLMSAGDGTAKPQDDDIVRSKTIAKVTSTQVSNTYDDGTYCVPCVLMAC